VVRRLLLVCALLAACGASEPAGEPAPARNLLWISLDTLRADRLGCYGYDRPTTPTLDALAARGVRFEDASAPSPWTMPSHASLFTGRYPSRSGVVSFVTEMRPDAQHVAELLAARGFQTIAVVSNHALAMHGLERGFQTFDYVERDLSDGPSAVTPATIRRLEERDRSRPFFALAHYIDVHARYRAEQRYVQEFVRPYDGEITGRNAQFLEHLTGRRPFRPDDVAHLSDLYDAVLRQLDDQIADLFAYLEREHLLEDTLVVITSDHGEEFFDHHGVSHAMTQYQELVRVPLLLLGAGIPAGVTVSEPVSLIDLLPTSLARLGIAAPAGIDGLDLTSTWRGGVPLPERLLYFEADCETPTGPAAIIDPGTKRAVRDDRYKLHYDLERGVTALFDLERDPLEQQDLLPGNGDRAAELSSALRSFLDASPGQATEAELTLEQLEKLNGLGYVQGRE